MFIIFFSELHVFLMKYCHKIFDISYINLIHLYMYPSRIRETPVWGILCETFTVERNLFDNMTDFVFCFSLFPCFLLENILGS